MSEPAWGRLAGRADALLRLAPAQRLPRSCCCAAVHSGGSSGMPVATPSSVSASPTRQAKGRLVATMEIIRAEGLILVGALKALAALVGVQHRQYGILSSQGW